MGEADFLIRPGFEPTSVLSFAQRGEAIHAGNEASIAVLPALRAWLGADQSRR